MELRHLRYFMAVAEESHITRAAERLGIQQPPLSRFVRKLERNLGAQLFIRKPRGVQLTEAGLALYRGARNIIAEVESAVDTTRRTAAGERGRIAIGVTPTGPFVPFVPKVIREFREAFPHVSVTFEERLSGELIDQIKNGRIDVCFLWTPRAEGLSNNALLREPLVVALPSGHTLAKDNEPIPVRALANDTFIVYGRKDGFGLYASTIVACHAAGFNPNFGQESPRLASALNLVAAGLGIFFVPSSVQCVGIHGVVYRSLQGPNAPKSILTLMSRRGDASAAVQKFVSFVKKAAKRL